MFDTLETVSTVINNKDENGKSIVDYFLDSSVMHAVISSLLVDLGAEGDMMIYVPESSLMTNEMYPSHTPFGVCDFVSILRIFIEFQL